MLPQLASLHWSCLVHLCSNGESHCECQEQVVALNLYNTPCLIADDEWIIISRSRAAVLNISPALLLLGRVR
jgi:hypothetical protein